MAKYWSAAVALKKPQVTKVATIKPAVPCAMRKKSSVMTSKKPDAASVPPKVMAQMISQMVPSMPAMPPDSIKSLSRGLLMAICVSP